MKTYVFDFSAPCSQEEFCRYLEQRIQEENAAAGKALKIKLKWKRDGQFDLRVNFYSHIDETCIEKGILSFSAEAQIGITASFSEIFRGTIESEGKGGCIVRGRFHHILWAYGGLFLLFAASPLLGLLKGMKLFSASMFWAVLFCGAVGLYPFFDFYRSCDSYPSSQWIIGFLEDCSTRWQDSLDMISE